MISGENVSICADDHARAEALKRLFTLPLRKLSPEKLSQRVIGKRKRGKRPRHRLGSEDCNNAGRHLLDDRGEGCDNPRLHGRSFLCCSRKSARGDAQHRADQQPDGPENSSSHETFPLQENRTLNGSRPFLV
jgi:hypothetical protein